MGTVWWCSSESSMILVSYQVKYNPVCGTAVAQTTENIESKVWTLNSIFLTNLARSFSLANDNMVNKLSSIFAFLTASSTRLTIVQTNARVKLVAVTVSVYNSSHWFSIRSYNEPSYKPRICRILCRSGVSLRSRHDDAISPYLQDAEEDINYSKYRRSHSTRKTRTYSVSHGNRAMENCSFLKTATWLNLISNYDSENRLSNFMLEEPVSNLYVYAAKKS